jgi:hypothetical protein
MPAAILLPSLAFAGPEQVDEVVVALSSRHPLPCPDIEALTPTPADTLLHVVDTITLPPWAPMHAAECLLRGHAVAVRPAIETWVVDPDKQGLGRMVLNRLDVLPTEVSVPVARRALEGPQSELAAQRVAASVVPEVRALSAPDSAPGAL